jgi:hypothetical protein
MTLWRLIRDQGFPEGVLITPNRRAWDETAVAVPGGFRAASGNAAPLP